MEITDHMILDGAKALFRQLFDGLEWSDNKAGKELCVAASYAVLTAALKTTSE